MVRASALGLVACLLGGTAPAARVGRLTAQDLQLAGRVLHFIDLPPSGAGNLAIVFAQDVPGSEDEAHEAAASLPDGLQVGSLTLRPVVVEQNRLADLRDYAAIVTADGVHAPAVRDAMGRHHVPCLTTHLPQVQDGGCLVGLRSRPAVAIQLNGQASAAAGIRFATAFRMMVQEL